MKSYTILSALLLACWLGLAAPSSVVRRTHEEWGSEEEKLTFLNNTITALDKATAFLKQDYSSINVDGLFGIRLCEGSVEETARECKTPEFNCPPELIKHLDDLARTINMMGDKAIPYVQAQDEEYFTRFIQTVDGPYVVSYNPAPLGEAISKAGTDMSYDESTGDRCFSILMGTYTERDGTKYDRCTVTDDCWTMMTRPNSAAYAITHQLLYFIFAEKAGCKDEVEDYARKANMGSLRDVDKYFCGSIYSEMEQEVLYGKVAEIMQDLFLEQSVLCGILGFQDIFAKDWISMVLNWQTSMGCFTLQDDMLMGMTEEILQQANAGDDKKNLEELLIDEAHQIEDASSRGTNRKLLRETLMKGDCLAHKTGLGFGTLGAYVRFLVNLAYGPR